MVSKQRTWWRKRGNHNILQAHIVAIALCNNTWPPQHWLDNFVITAKYLQVIKLRVCRTTGITSRERALTRTSMDGGRIRTSCERGTITQSNRGVVGRPWCLTCALTLSWWCILHARLSCGSFSWVWPPSWCWVFLFPCHPLQSWFQHSWWPWLCHFPWSWWSPWREWHDFLNWSPLMSRFSNQHEEQRFRVGLFFFLFYNTIPSFIQEV